MEDENNNNKEQTTQTNGTAELSLSSENNGTASSESVVALSDIEKLSEAERRNLRQNKFKSEDQIRLEQRELRFFGEKQKEVTPEDREKRFAADGNNATPTTQSDLLKSREERFAVKDENKLILEERMKRFGTENNGDADKISERLKRFPEMKNSEREIYQPPKKRTNKKPKTNNKNKKKTTNSNSPTKRKKFNGKSNNTTDTRKKPRY